MKNFLLILLVLSCGCGRQETGDIGVIDLLSRPSGEITDLSEIASDIEYIPFQTSEESLIRYINDFKTSNNKFYINTLMDIICFDKTGRYLYKLSKAGRGPGEYTFIYDYDISSDDDFLMILSTRILSIFKETENGFVFSKTLNINFQPSRIGFVPGQNNILLSYSSAYGIEPYRNVIINMNGDTLDVRPNYNKYIKIGKSNIGFKDENMSFKYNNSLYFKQFFSDTVFTVERSGNIGPYLILDSHGKRPTTEARANSDYLEEHMSEMILLHNIMEVSRYFIYSFTFESSTHYFIYDKFSNKKLEINSKTFLKDDISGGVNFEPKFCSDGKFYSWVDALALKKYISGNSFKNSVVKNPEKKKALEKLADSLNITDNPVLIVVTPKK